MKKVFTRELPFLCTIPALLWQALFLVVPVGIIVYLSFVTPLGTAIHGTLAHYKTLLAPMYFRIIARSLLLSLNTAFFCLVFGYPVAYFLALRAYKWKNVLLFLLTLPFWTNFLVQIYAWYYVLEHNGLMSKMLTNLYILKQPVSFVTTQFAIYLVAIYCYLPFMVMPLYSILSKLNIKLLEASADLGARPWQTFWRITIPLSMPGIRTGVLLVLVPAFGEFAIPSLLGGAHNMYVGSLIYYFFLVARNNALGAAFTCMSGIVLLMVAAIINYLLGRVTRMSKKKDTQ